MNDSQAGPDDTVYNWAVSNGAGASGFVCLATWPVGSTTPTQDLIAGTLYWNMQGIDPTVLAFGTTNLHTYSARSSSSLIPDDQPPAVPNLYTDDSDTGAKADNFGYLLCNNSGTKLWTYTYSIGAPSVLENQTLDFSAGCLSNTSGTAIPTAIVVGSKGSNVEFWTQQSGDVDVCPGTGGAVNAATATVSTDASGNPITPVVRPAAQIIMGYHQHWELVEEDPVNTTSLSSPHFRAPQDINNLLPPGSGFTSFQATGIHCINDDGVIIGTAGKDENGDGVFDPGTQDPTTHLWSGPDHYHGVMLFPVYQQMTNRDDLTLTWSSAQYQLGIQTVYAGTTTGDMVKWSLDLSGMGAVTSILWTATDSQGNVVTGPSGNNYWQISDGANDPAGNTTLTWKPDNYTIKCTITFPNGATEPIQFTQKIGWRTEDYAVIGQIVNTSTFSSGGPATPAASALFRAAIVTDCAGAFTLGLPLSGIVSSALPDEAFGFIDVATWAPWPHDVTTQGPLSYFGAVTEANRFWILEKGLNASVDTPIVSSPMTAAQMSSTQGAGNYRIFHHYQTRFTLDLSGKIDPNSFYDIHDDCINGKTKLTIPAGEFNPIKNNQEISIDALPSEASKYNRKESTSAAGTAHSCYASARVDFLAQNVNWHIFGQDVPWIYSEVICNVASDHTVTSSIKMSVDMTWKDNATLSGNTNFNNLNIYKGTFDSIGHQLNYTRVRDALSMEGQLESFIYSVPLGTWPTPPTTPSVE